MQKYHDIVQDSEGNGLTTASIYIYEAGTGTLATLKKDDETTALSNPITSADVDNYDSLGNFGFKAVNGIYDIKITTTGNTWRRERVLFDFSDDTTFGGNVGITTSPHTGWTSSFSVLRVRNQTALWDSGSTHLTNNIYHDGTNYRHISTGTSAHLNITSTGSFVFNVGTSVAADAIASRTAALTLDNSANSTFGGDVSLGDNQYYYAGVGNDLRLHHSGTNSFVDNITGDFFIRQFNDSGLVYVQCDNSVGTAKTCATFGGATPAAGIRYDGIEVLKTISGGFESGSFSATGAGTGIQYSSVTTGEVRTSRTSTSARTHIQFYNPNGSVGTITTTGTTTAYNTTSDKRLKTSHGLVSNARDLVNKIEVHNYHFNSDPDLELQGVMAQDIYKIYPNAVSKPESDDDTWGVDYSKLVPLLIANIQELNKNVEALTCQ